MGSSNHHTGALHGVVDAFMMHCCRNSLIEGLLYGHPLIMLQIFADQGPNTRLMEGREVGLQVTRDGDDGSFDRHDDIASGSGLQDRGRFQRGSLEQMH